MFLHHEQLKIAMLSVHSCPVGELGTSETGGMSVYIRELAKELGSRNHHVDIYTRSHGSNHKHIIELSPNVRLIHIEAGVNGGIDKLAIYPHIAEFARGLESYRLEAGINYDLVHSHYWLSGCVGRWAQYSWNTPHIIMFHTLGAIKNATGMGHREPELRLQNEKKLIRTCDRIIAATEREKREMRSYYGTAPENIDTIPCGVNLSLFQPVNKVKARQAIGLNPNEKVILYVGRFDPLKGLDRLFQAVSRLKYGPGFKLVIVGGDDSDQPEMTKWIETCYQLGIDDSVVFLGRAKQEDLPHFYSAADITVMPSYHESFGLVALESMACGTPVMAGDVGGFTNIVQDKRTGYLLKGDVTLGLICQLNQFLDGKGPTLLPAAMIRASISPYCWSRIADAIIQSYRELLERRMVQVA
jgi:D-inositol-3-phosphate glycosyltransferase